MNISTHKTMSVVCWPLIKVCEWMGRNYPEQLVKLRYYGKFKKWPDLANPKDLNEKILWLKLFSDTSIWTERADKFKVRSYIEELGLGEYLVKLYGKWDKVEDIDFTKLPSKVIFKANNGDGKGTNLIVKEVHEANHDALRRTFKKWLNNMHLGELSAEPQYKGMPPCIIAEEVLELPKGSKSLTDYKIWCINGEPLYIWTCSDRDEDGGGADVMLYDLAWHPHPEYSVFTNEYRQGKLLPEPKNLAKMIDIAKRLSVGTPILRVDLYNIEGKIYFGELTYTSQGGMMDFYTPEFLEMLGRSADISHIKKVR